MSGIRRNRKLPRTRKMLKLVDDIEGFYGGGYISINDASLKNDSWSSIGQ